MFFYYLGFISWLIDIVIGMCLEFCILVVSKIILKIVWKMFFGGIILDCVLN